MLATRMRLAAAGATEPDTTAPTLSNPTVVNIVIDGGSATCNVRCTTNEGNGRVYWVISGSGTSPSKAQVKAGQTHTGAAGVDADSWSAPSPSGGTQSQGASGMTASVFYWVYFMHEDAAGNQSAIASHQFFTAT